MIDKNSPEYQAAKDRVKVSHFTEQGYDITGLVHIGANDGYEIEHYLKMGIKPVLAFEPLPRPRKIMWDKYRDNPDVHISGAALGNINGVTKMNVTDGDGKGSSFLKELRPVQSSREEAYHIRRWSDLEAADIWKGDYNCCVIDAQGMELDVLRGMDDQIQLFNFISVECSLIPIYKGEADVFEVARYLERMGFVLDVPLEKIPAHDDVFFINRRVLHPPAPPAPIPKGDKLNIGSGQRRFDVSQGWVNVDCVSRPGQVPDLLCDVGKEALPYGDGSMEYVVLHHCYEHMGLGEGHSIIREANRVLRPGGSLIVTVPDMLKLVKGWLDGTFSDYIFMVNVYGAYQGSPSDRHAWGYRDTTLIDDLVRAAKWSIVRRFDWRNVEGADIARDDRWILGVEAIK